MMIKIIQTTCFCRIKVENDHAATPMDVAPPNRNQAQFAS